MTAGENGTAPKMSAYILDPQGKDNRVLHVFGIGLVSDPRDPVAVANELSLYKGNAFDCIPTRQSVPRAEGEKLTESDWLKMAELFSERYLHGRPGVFVVHGDSEGSYHMHGLSAFLDPQGHCLNFSGRAAYREGERRMEIADEISKSLGLTPTPREEGRYTKAKDRRSISVERLRNPIVTKEGADKGKEPEPKYAWTDDLKARIREAVTTATNREEFVSVLALQGVNTRYRGSGVSFDFVDADKKQRVIRGRRLGMDFEVFCDRRIEQSMTREDGGDVSHRQEEQHER